MLSCHIFEIASRRPPDGKSFETDICTGAIMAIGLACDSSANDWPMTRMPTAIIGVPHSVLQDDMYMGYRIPKGASVVANAWAINSDPERHPEPRRFNPDRFGNDTSSLPDSISNPDPTKRPTFTFGAGRRICQGMHVAERSLFLGISRLLWGFDVSPAKDADGNDVLPDPSKLTQGFVCMPEPFQATIKPRSAERVSVMKKAWEDAQKDLDPVTKQWKQWKYDTQHIGTKTASVV